jgi:hypothetical protein
MTRRLLACLTALVLSASALSCASAARAAFTPDGGSYGADDLTQLLQDADLSAFSDIPTDDAAETRTRILASLRQEGDDAAALADTLTSDFPTDITSVPAIVERGTYEGEQAWIVIESWGEPGGTLAYRRIWVFSYDERAVVAATSAR